MRCVQFLIVSHAFLVVELPMIFGTAELNFTITSAEKQLTLDMQQAYSNFAYSGDPNSPTSLNQYWPDASENATYIFDTPSYSATGFNNDNCDFWDGVGYTFGGNNMVKLLAKYSKQNGGTFHKKPSVSIV